MTCSALNIVLKKCWRKKGYALSRHINNMICNGNVQDGTLSYAHCQKVYCLKSSCFASRKKYFDTC